MASKKHCRKYEDAVLRGINPEDIFGVQRTLDPAVVMSFGREVLKRQASGELSDRLSIKLRPKLVLLGRKDLVSSLGKGWAHQPAEVIRRRVDNNCRPYMGEMPDVDVLDFRLDHGRLLNMVIKSGELEEQKSAIASAIGSCGLRTLACSIEESPAVVNIGKINKLIPQGERELILDQARGIFDEVHCFEPVDLGGTEFYPQHQPQEQQQPLSLVA